MFRCLGKFNFLNACCLFLFGISKAGNQKGFFHVPLFQTKNQAPASLLRISRGSKEVFRFSSFIQEKTFHTIRKAIHICDLDLNIFLPGWGDSFSLFFKIFCTHLCYLQNRYSFSTLTDSVLKFFTLI